MSIQQGSRIRTTAGDTGRVERLDPDKSIAYVQLDEKPTPDGGTPVAVEDIELLQPD
jgi:hypothetical protein